jgi:hypothetical protein
MDRLSLDQVRAHPWMVNGRRPAPLGLARWKVPTSDAKVLIRSAHKSREEGG